MPKCDFNKVALQQHIFNMVASSAVSKFCKLELMYNPIKVLGTFRRRASNKHLLLISTTFQNVVLIRDLTIIQS